MDRSEKKQRRREWERRLTVGRALAKSREARENLVLPGIGARLVQVLLLPSFDPIHSWDVRDQEDDGLKLYHSTGRAGQETRLSPGYRRLDCPPETLAGFHCRLTALRLPPMPPPPEFGGLDGTTYEVALGADLWSCRLRWWEDGTEEWADLNGLAREMIATFQAAPPIPDPLLIGLTAPPGAER